MENEHRTDIRLIAVFILGISVGISFTLVYFTWRGPHHEVTIRQTPGDMEQVDD